MSHLYSSSTAGLYSEEEDSCITSSSSFEVTSSSSSVFQYGATEPLKRGVLDDLDDCCCVSTEELDGDPTDQPVVGWQKRNACPNSSCYHLSAQSEKSLLSSCVVVESCNQIPRANNGNEKLSRSSLSRAVINLGSESKSSIRSYIHSTPAIPYTFHHHLGSDIGLHIEEYRKSYTYPRLEAKHRRTSLSSTSTAAMVKPTLFVLDNDCTAKVPLKVIVSTK